jgi:DNA-binding CsgD family transcriptional regulator
MGQLPDLQQALRRLGLALSSVRHDRWVLGYLRGGCLQPIAGSEMSRKFLHSRPLMPLARRALFEQKPTVINTVFRNEESSIGYDWELDWPAILYAPVGQRGHRPIGLLIIGCRSDHWYPDDDVAYAQSLGYMVAPMVTALRGPMSRLTEAQSEVAHLLGYGLSAQEIARAIKVDDRLAHTLVDQVTRKLQSITADDLKFPALQLKRMTW